MAKLILKNIELGNCCLIKAEKMREERAGEKNNQPFHFSSYQSLSLFFSYFNFTFFKSAGLFYKLKCN